MTKDFSQHSKLIHSFRGKVSQNDFESHFSAATKALPKSERFILKMELKRLAGECMRLIDLRGLVDGTCKEYQHEGRTHYLDELAIQVFEENVKAYQGYTFGVYEAVTNTENNFRVIYQREKNDTPVPAGSTQLKILEKTQYPASLLTFGPYKNRVEERMNFAVAVQIILEDKSTIESTSSDISVHGCKLRVTNQAQFKEGQVVELQFSGLAQEFSFGDDIHLYYQVKNVHVVEEIQLIGLERTHLAENKRDGFKQFLVGYIQGNKRRYKINLDNSISALQSRHFETTVLPKISELPVYIEQQAKKLSPRYALTCNNNQNIYQYWQDDQGHSTLDYLLNGPRLTRLIAREQQGQSLLVYCFIHQSKTGRFFYSADECQLSVDKQLMAEFIAFASSKSHFAVFDLQLLNVNEKNAYSPLTLADSLSKKNEFLNSPPSQEVKDIIKQLPYIAVINQVADKITKDDFQCISFKGIDLNKVKPFGHKKRSDKLVIDQVGIHYKNQRQEPRFKYQTEVNVAAEDVNWQGTSVDFSVSGIKVILNKSAILKQGEVVYLTFDKLQKITSSFDLSQLPYQIVRINKKKNVINLKVHVEQHQHIGRSFFRLLIEKNKGKLTPDEYAMMTPGMSRALINVYSSSLMIPYLMVQVSGSRYKIEALTCSGEYGKLLPAMKKLSDRKQLYNLYPLMNNLDIQQKMTSALKKMLVSDPAVYEQLYISIFDNESHVDKAVSTKLVSEFSSRQQRQRYIERAQKRGRFFAVKVLMSRSAEPEIDFLSPELSYISSYAIHRGKQLEQDIWSVIGSIQLFDITHEVLLREQLLGQAADNDLV